MVVGQQWLENIKQTRGEKFLQEILAGSHTDHRGNVHIDPQTFAQAQRATSDGPTVKFAKSMGQWAGQGFKRVSPHVYDQRMGICRGCEYWQENARLGYGKCLKCGCGKGKQWLPHEQCPIGKWGKET